jgi:hypothetical protein|tara:strand:- start:60 stop:272 length:213 start_codon:yes stop_codon:yes gene_type:complete
MISDVIYTGSIDIGMERISSAIIFGLVLRDHKKHGRDLDEFVDTMLIITDIDGLIQVSRDYKQHIQPIIE